MFSPNTSDLTGSFRLRSLNAELKQRAATLGNELASGRAEDVTKKLDGRVDRLGAVSRSITMMSSYEMATTELQNRATGLQESLSVIQSITEKTGVQFLAAATTPTDTVVNATSASAAEGLKSAIDSLNMQLAGRSLFSGAPFDSPAAQPAVALLDDLTALTSGATTSAQVIQTVDDYFNQPGGGFETSAYLGSTTVPESVQISQSEKAGIPVTARDPRLRQTLQGLALSALLSRGILSGDNASRAEVLRQAGNDVLTATDGLIGLRAEIGGKQERIDIVAIENQAGKTALREMLDTMTNAAGSETATELQSVQTRREELYISTSRLSQLSLVRFLR